jgi:hypothetical protein
VPDNTNPQAVRWSNDKLRPLADRFGQLYNQCKSLQAEFVADGAAALFPATADLVADGSDIDGRTPVTNQDINTLIGVVSSFITYMEQTGNANRNAVLKIAVNPERS